MQNAKRKRVKGFIRQIIRLLDFSVNIIKCVKRFKSSFESQHIGKQLIRSSSSAGANYEEARGAESKADFVHKMQLVLKELRETMYWLKLAVRLEIFELETLNNLSMETEELVKIFSKSIITAKSKL